MAKRKRSSDNPILGKENVPPPIKTTKLAPLSESSRSTKARFVPPLRMTRSRNVDLSEKPTESIDQRSAKDSVSGRTVESPKQRNETRNQLSAKASASQKISQSLVLPTINTRTVVSPEAATKAAASFRETSGGAAAKRDAPISLSMFSKASTSRPTGSAAQPISNWSSRGAPRGAAAKRDEPISLSIFSKASTSRVLPTGSRLSRYPADLVSSGESEISDEESTTREGTNKVASGQESPDFETEEGMESDTGVEEGQQDEDEGGGQADNEQDENEGGGQAGNEQDENEGGGQAGNEQDEDEGGGQADNEQDEDEEESANGRRRIRFKRRIRQATSKSRQQRKTARNKGEQYVNCNGKLIEEKLPLPLSDCRSKCSSKLSPETCLELCNNLWKGLGDANRRSSYIASLVEVVPKASLKLNPTVSPSKRKSRNYSHIYHVIVNGQNITVCKGCFVKVFRVSSKFIDIAVTKKLSTTGGIVANDARGRASNPLDEDRRNEVKDFLMKIPKYKSHYARNRTDDLFLPAHLNLKIIYEEYCSDLASGEEGKVPVSRWIFEKEFHEMGLKIKARKIDTCVKCDKLDNAVTFSQNAEERKKNQELLAAHHKKWEEARDQKRKDKSKAKKDKKIRTVAFDLQQCLPTPLLETSVVFYKRQLWTYNLTIHNCATKDSTHNMWHEGEGERGANQIGSCLYYYILALPDDVEELILWSDTCGGQNKNSIVAAALTTALLHKPTLNRIEQKFLVPGHTHMECDTDHSAIEGCRKKARGVYLPRDWMTLVRNANPKFTVNHLKTQSHLDFKALMNGRSSPLVKRKKDTDGSVFSWKEVVWMRHERGRPGIVAYKTQHDEELPFSYLDIRRKRNVAVTLSPDHAYNEPIPISFKKKDDLVSLLPLIDPECAEFYLNLRSDLDMDDYDPDLLPSTDEEESDPED